MREFNGAWQRLREREINNLSPKEPAKFEQLRTEPQQEAFFLSRSFSNHAGGADFSVGQSSLADRLSITHQGASPLIAGLEELGAIKKNSQRRHKQQSRTLPLDSPMNAVRRRCRLAFVRGALESPH